MLHAISIIGRAKAYKRTSVPLAIIELVRGVSLMNKSIKMDPDNVENRKYRLRHLLGITMHSPKKFFKEVNSDLKFFEEIFTTLNNEDKSYYLSALGEYEIFCGDKDRGILILTDVVNNYKGTTIYDYTKTYLETVL